MEALRDVYRSCRACPICQASGGTVLWEGNASAPLAIVGEAPGRVEHRLGRPFVGPAGDEVLNAMLQNAGLRRGADVYLTNVVKGWPLASDSGERPRGRTPTAQEASFCGHLILDKELKIVQPRAILAMGTIAAQYLLETRQPIGKIRGRWGAHLGIPVIATYHPAYVLYLSGRSSPQQVAEVKWIMWEDLKQAMARAGFPTDHLPSPPSTLQVAAS